MRRVTAEAAREPGAERGRGLTQGELRCRCRDQTGVQRLAAPIVEDARARAHVDENVLRRAAIMYVAMARIDVDRMLGIPEGDPVTHLPS
jgi:hypothetical protein